MMGMYRMIKDGKPVFYELLLITEENGSLAIKLKHFHADLRGWEERDASVRFPLVAKRDGRIYFDGMTFVGVETIGSRSIWPSSRRTARCTRRRSSTRAPSRSYRVISPG